MEFLSTIETWFQRVLQALNLDVEQLVQAGLRVLGIWLLAWLAIRLVGIAARRIEHAVNDGDDGITTLRERRGRTISQLLRSVGRVVVLVVAVLLTFNVFIDIGPVLAGAGILGLAVSFGAQSLVKDVISGFFILFENQFAIGDVIDVAGKAGVVERMTMRVVVLRDLQGVMHVIPNGQITVVSNMTRGWSRAVIDIGVAYGTDVDKALAVVTDEATRFGEDATWKPQLDGPLEVAGVESLGDNAVTIRVLVRTQPGMQWSAGREFRRRIKNRLDAEGIEIPFPQRTVHVRVDNGDPAMGAAALGADMGAVAEKGRG